MDSKTLLVWAQVVTSVAALLIFVGCLIAAFFLKDQTSLTMLYGAAIGFAGAGVQFWLGSSSGSQKKDEVIAAQQKPPSP